MSKPHASPGCVIRAAQPGDIDALLRLCRAHAAYERAPLPAESHSERLARALFAPEPRVSCLVVEANGQMVGYASWSREFSTWNAADFIHVDCLYLEADYRGRGLGQALMTAIAARVPLAGATHLEWQTPAWNGGAVRFYERLGARGTPKIRFAWRPETQDLLRPASSQET